MREIPANWIRTPDADPMICLGAFDCVKSEGVCAHLHKMLVKNEDGEVYYSQPVYILVSELPYENVTAGLLKEYGIEIENGRAVQRRPNPDEGRHYLGE